MTNKLFRSFIVALFVMFGALTVANAEMKCAPGKCGGQMMGNPPKGAKADANTSCPSNVKCNAKMKEKCTPKMKEKCATTGKCPVQEPAKK